jgi:hypothetical protein
LIAGTVAKASSRKAVRAAKIAALALSRRHHDVTFVVAKASWSSRSCRTTITITQRPSAKLLNELSKDKHMPVKLVGKKKPYEPKETDEVICHVHGFKTTWGALNSIQRLACEEGLDTTEDLPCLLKSR